MLISVGRYKTIEFLNNVTNWFNLNVYSKLLLLLLLFLLFLNRFFAMNNLHFSLFNETPFSSMSEMKFNEDFAKAFYVRCKDYSGFEKTVTNMTGLYSIYMSFKGLVDQVVQNTNWATEFTAPKTIELMNKTLYSIDEIGDRKP